MVTLSIWLSSFSRRLQYGQSGSLKHIAPVCHCLWRVWWPDLKANLPRWFYWPAAYALRWGCADFSDQPSYRPKVLGIVTCINNLTLRQYFVNTFNGRRGDRADRNIWIILFKFCCTVFTSACAKPMPAKLKTNVWSQSFIKFQTKCFKHNAEIMA